MSGGKMLGRRMVVERLLSQRGDSLVVSGLGASSWDVAAVGDHEHNFYLWGAMGTAAMVGLGLSLAQPDRRVAVITGDGEMLMGLSSLATIAVAGPSNLTLIVLDNERFGETGGQLAHTAYSVDLAAASKAAGFSWSETVRNETEFLSAVPGVFSRRGPVFLLVKILAGNSPLVLPPRDGTYLKHRFRNALPDANRALIN